MEDILLIFVVLCFVSSLLDEECWLKQDNGNTSIGNNRVEANDSVVREVMGRLTFSLDFVYEHVPFAQHVDFETNSVGKQKKV